MANRSIAHSRMGFQWNVGFVALFAVLALSLPAAERDYSGTFNDERVILELKKEAQDADAYQGSIKFKGNSFVIAAKAKADQLTGTFKDTAENSFDFVARFDGAVLNFSTGKSTFKLAARPVINPLETIPVSPVPVVDPVPHAVVPAVQPHAAEAALAVPAFLKQGTRITWHGGNSTVAGSRLVPDEKGWIENKQKQKFGLKDSRGGGGVGYTQVNILHADAKSIVADVRNFLIVDIEKNICQSMEHIILTGNAEGLGDRWINPAKLAQMKQENGDGDSVTRVDFTVGKQLYKAIAIRHQGQDGYYSRTYDLATGMLLFGGTIDGDPNLMITDPNTGVVQRFDGGKQFSHSLLVSARDVKTPWAGAKVPQGLARGKVLNYAGSYTQINANLPPLPGFGMSVSYEVDSELTEDAIGAKMHAVYSIGQGLPPSEVDAKVAFGSGLLSGLWISPDAVRNMQANQVLDEDPITRYQVLYAGSNGNSATIVERGPKDVSEQSYDMNTGLLMAVRYNQQKPAGMTVQIQYQLQR